MAKLHVKHLDSISKITGLIGKKIIYPTYFETRFGIHTFGMKQPIDVFVLDSDNNIVSIKRHLNPNGFYFWNPKYFRVLETPINLIPPNDNKVFLIIEK